MTELKQTELDPEQLTNHPRNVEIYGTPQPEQSFVDDIRESGGPEQPIVVTDDSHFVDDSDAIVIISGHRRVAAASQTEHDVRVSAYKTYETPWDERAALLRYNQYRDKTFSQKMGEGDEHFIIESELADQRQKSGTTLEQNFAQGRAPQVRDKVAEKIGIGSGETYRKAKKVWDAAQEDDDEFAQSLVDDLDSEDESIHGAYTQFREYETDEDDSSEEMSSNEQESEQDDTDVVVDDSETDADDRNIVNSDGEADTTVNQERSSSQQSSGVRDDSESHTTGADEQPFDLNDSDDNSRDTETVTAERLSGDEPFTKNGERADDLDTLSSVIEAHSSNDDPDPEKTQKVVEMAKSVGEDDKFLHRAIAAYMTVLGMEDNLYCPCCENHNVTLTLSCCGESVQDHWNSIHEQYDEMLHGTTVETQSIRGD